MLKPIFYPREVKFYTDNVHWSVTNSMSAPTVPGLISLLPGFLLLLEFTLAPDRHATVKQAVLSLRILVSLLWVTASKWFLSTNST